MPEQQSISVGTIGAGTLAQRYRGHAVAAGYKVNLSNSRGSESLSRLVDRLGPNATAGTVAEAAAADLVLLAVGWHDVSEAVKPVSDWTGRVVIDATNLVGLGIGSATVVGLDMSSVGVAPEDVGVAGSLANVVQQIGPAVGIAVLSTVAATATTQYATGHTGIHNLAAHATVHGSQPRSGTARRSSPRLPSSARRLCGPEHERASPPTRWSLRRSRLFRPCRRARASQFAVVQLTRRAPRRPCGGGQLGRPA